MDVVTESTITCPECATATTMTMPEDSCAIIVHCPHCDAVLRPKTGDCCVFCSYGTVPCPPIQRDRLAGAPTEMR